MQEKFDSSALPVDGREGLVLFFTVSNQAFGMRLTDVSHIMPLLGNQAKTGGRDKSMLQTISLENETVPIIDLAKFLGIPAAVMVEERILILFRDGTDRFGLLADEVISIVSGHQVPEMAYPRLLGEEGARVYGGFFSRNDRLILALNPDYIRNFIAPARKR